MTSTTMTVSRSAFAIKDLDYHFIRASMVILFLFFGYAKWFKYDVPGLEPFITHGPLIFWLYPLLGPQGATWFLGVTEWTICSLLFLGFWDKRLGVLGAAGATVTFIGNRHHHSVLPQRLGAVGGRVSGNDIQCRVPDEGCGSPCRVLLSPETGPRANGFFSPLVGDRTPKGRS